MSDPRYKDIGHPLTRVMEECAEVIQVGCKIERFGWQGYNPSDPDKVTNLIKLRNEMDDVIEAFEDFKKYLTEVGMEWMK